MKVFYPYDESQYIAGFVPVGQYLNGGSITLELVESDIVIVSVVISHHTVLVLKSDIVIVS